MDTQKAINSIRHRSAFDRLERRKLKIINSFLMLAIFAFMISIIAGIWFYENKLNDIINIGA
jgi:hypothetical protein